MFSLGFGRAVVLPLLGKDDGLVTSKVIIALLLIAEELGNYSMSDLENSAQNETIISQAVQAGSAGCCLIHVEELFVWGVPIHTFHITEFLFC